MDFVDFLENMIYEEAEDADTYLDWADKCSDSKCRDVLNEIADQELVHQKKLISALAVMAKKALK